MYIYYTNISIVPKAFPRSVIKKLNPSRSAADASGGRSYLTRLFLLPPASVVHASSSFSFSSLLWLVSVSLLLLLLLFWPASCTTEPPPSGITARTVGSTDALAEGKASTSTAAAARVAWSFLDFFLLMALRLPSFRRCNFTSA